VATQQAMQQQILVAALEVDQVVVVMELEELVVRA
jgi:hypothetical protein